MKNIYLIGMMGCGKSACAGALGRRLKRRVLDTDEILEREAGCSIREIFAQRGEACFRDMETSLCRRLSGTNGLIVATGGGLPLREENRRLLRENGIVVFLNRDPDEIFTSVSMSARPLGQDGLSAFRRRFAQRLPLYRQCAHMEIASSPSVRETVADICQKLEEYL